VLSIGCFADLSAHFHRETNAKDTEEISIGCSNISMSFDQCLPKEIVVRCS
jgi:hypothetical protein